MVYVNAAEAPPGLMGHRRREERKVCPIRGQDSDHPRHSTRAALTPPPRLPTSLKVSVAHGVTESRFVF